MLTLQNNSSIVGHPLRCINVLIHAGSGYFKISAVTSSDLYLFMDQQKCLVRESKIPERSSPLRRKVPTLQYTLFYNNKPLSRHGVNLCDYGINQNSIISCVNYFGAGGNPAEVTIGDVQTPSIVYPLLEQGALMGVSSMLDRLIPGEGSEQIMHAVECVFIGYKDLLHVQNKNDLFFWCQKFVKMCSRTNFSTVASAVFMKGEKYDSFVEVMQRYLSNLDKATDDLFAEQSAFAFDSEESFESSLLQMRSMLNTVESVDQHPIIKRFVALTSYMLVFDMMKKVGIDFEWCEYSKAEQQAMTAKYCSKKGFVLCVLDVSLFIIERVYQVYKTGQWSSILHSGSAYEKWLDTATDLKRKSMLLANPGAHGFTVYEFIQNLKDHIEEGQVIVKYQKVDSKYESKIIKSALNDLIMIDANELTKRAARQNRDAPFAVLLSGRSGIGKSGVKDLMIRHYGQYFDLPAGDEYIFTRNPTDEYMSGFTPACWAAVYDDIAANNPDQIPEDVMVSEILQIVNNVPFLTNQADLPDKGKMPFRCELVVSTTNQPDLNADRYYQNPGAALRRFIFPVHVVIKDEFSTTGNGDGFIDRNKAIAPTDGSLPNYWNFHIMKYSMKMNGKREMADIVPVLDKNGEPVVYTDINDFLVAYIRTVESHKRAQIQSKNAYSSPVKVCRKCARVENSCACIAEQTLSWSDNTVLTEWVHVPIPSYSYFMAFIRFLLNCLYTYLISYIISFFGYMFVKFGVTQRIISFFLQIRFLRWCLWKLVEYLLPDRLAVRIIGETINRRKELKVFGYFIVGITAVIGSYNVYKFFKKNDNIKAEPQGNRISVGKPISVSTPEESNVWHTTTYECTTVDVPLSSKSLVSKSQEEIGNMLSNNCVHVTIQYDDGSFYSQKAICLKGQKYVMNAHALKLTHPDGTPVKVYKFRINVGKANVGVNQLVSVEYRLSDFLIVKKQDLALFEILGAPPKKDITKFIPPRSFTGINDGFLLIKDKLGNRTFKNLTNVTKMWSPPSCGTADCELYGYTCASITEFGECGAMLIINAPRGPVIGGYHAYVSLKDGQPSQYAMGIALDIETVEEILSEFANQGLILGDIEPNVIALDLKEGDRQLLPLHAKSTIAFCETGVAHVYGTLSGNRPNPRSKVCSTPLREAVEKQYGQTAQFGQPVMQGWNCWRKNLLPLLKKSAKYDKSILAKSCRSYILGVIKGLDASDSEWRSKVHVLDDYSTVNGIPGVKFVDQMNFNTSMGNPWCTTKKKFIYSKPTELKPDGKDFEEEIWDRVHNAYNCYREHKRYMPVFQMHLKDEAVPFQKIIDEKTRGFSSGPVDYSILCRKYLLSFVKLVQDNSLIFEAGPGTVCQSAQWQRIRDYLVKFGEDRMVAGDYKVFDKEMSADFVLFAMSVVYQICKEAGFDQEALDIIVGLAYDTAFPVTNFNGDLCEFFGSNPSGWPLTVIINGIVNSLYIRYAFFTIYPDASEEDFKKFVRLMTYGDDNIMGVSEETPKFTHYNIQQVLAGIGITYTTSDKSDRIVDFVHIDSESFLKRKWRFDSEIDFYVCPLEENSIFKSLTVWRPSDSVSPGFQMVSVVQSALYEYFYHGKEKFSTMRTFLMMACENSDIVRPYIKPSTFPTWEALKDHFYQASNGVETLQHGVFKYDTEYNNCVCVPETDIYAECAEQGLEVCQWDNPCDKTTLWYQVSESVNGSCMSQICSKELILTQQIIDSLVWKVYYLFVFAFLYFYVLLIIVIQMLWKRNLIWMKRWLAAFLFYIYVASVTTISFLDVCIVIVIVARILTRFVKRLL